MERTEWLKKMRTQAEALYDHLAPVYWVNFGSQPDPTELQFVMKFLRRMAPGSRLLQAGCGAGRYDALLAEAGHSVLGIDQSACMLARAREMHPVERYPRLHYEKRGLQEMEFEGEFDGATCIEAMEHIFPEDWPGIMLRFAAALKPGGLLYITVERADWTAVRNSYEKGKAQGLPLVFGELVDELEAAYQEVTSQQGSAITGDRSDQAVYHYYPDPEKVQEWFSEAGFGVEELGSGGWYEHFLLRKKD